MKGAIDRRAFIRRGIAARLPAGDAINRAWADETAGARA
jgi:hypothetical protein